MKQSEKTKRTKEKILSAALIEFGTKNYESASLNAICIENQISKGLIYHNFKNKDELYLQCVKMCYEKLMECLKSTEQEFKDVQEELREILHCRQIFFKENPYYRNIFFDSVLQPPRHLVGEVKQLKKEYDLYLAERYRKLISRLQLREGISKEYAVEYFVTFQEMFNGYFREKLNETDDFSLIIAAHESKLEQLLNVMLYGLAKETKGEDTKC